MTVLFFSLRTPGMRVALKLSIGIIHKTEKRFFQPRSGPVHRTLLTLVSLSLAPSRSLTVFQSFSLCAALYERSFGLVQLPSYLPA